MCCSYKVITTGSIQCIPVCDSFSLEGTISQVMLLEKAHHQQELKFYQFNQSSSLPSEHPAPASCNRRTDYDLYLYPKLCIFPTMEDRLWQDLTAHDVDTFFVSSTDTEKTQWMVTSQLWVRYVGVWTEAYYFQMRKHSIFCGFWIEQHVSLKWCATNRGLKTKAKTKWNDCSSSNSYLRLTETSSCYFVASLPHSLLRWCLNCASSVNLIRSLGHSVRKWSVPFPAFIPVQAALTVMWRYTLGDVHVLKIANNTQRKGILNTH